MFDFFKHIRKDFVIKHLRASASAQQIFKIAMLHTYCDAFLHE